MQKEELIQLVSKCYADIGGNTERPMTDETTFEELGLDSLETVELVIKLEDEIGFQIPPHIADECRTVGELVNPIIRDLDKLKKGTFNGNG